MSEQPEDAPQDLVRTRDFDVSGPIELDVSNGVGPVDIELTETTTARVEVAHDPAHGYPDWRSGLSGLLSWVTEQFSDGGIKPGNGRSATAAKERAKFAEAGIEAVRDTRIELTGNKLAVHAPSTVPLRTVPLVMKVVAPIGSHVGVRTGPGAVTISGSAGRLRVQTGSGAVVTDAITAGATVRTGSGQLRLGTVKAALQARSGSGPVEVAELHSASSVVTGSGDVWLGSVHDDVLVRSGSGGITVSEAIAGQTELITGSGELRVAVGKGVAADVDLTSATGQAISELAVADERPAEQPKLRVMGRTGSGQAYLTSTP